MKYRVLISYGGDLYEELFATYKDAFMRYCFWENAMLDRVGQVVSECKIYDENNNILLFERI